MKKILKFQRLFKKEIILISKNCIDDNILGNEIKIIARIYIKKNWFKNLLQLLRLYDIEYNRYMITKFNHVAIVVPNLDEAAKV